VPRQTTSLLDAAPAAAESSTAVRARVARALQRQVERQGGPNGRLGVADTVQHCRITPAARNLLAEAVERLPLSARTYHKVLRIARTLADMDDAPRIEPPHVAEAIGLRCLDRQALRTR